VVAHGSGDRRPARDNNWGEARPLAPTENAAVRLTDEEEADARSRRGSSTASCIT
jgi:hypothetical protein